MASEEDPEICRTCDNSRAWHDHFKPMHPFNNGDSGAKAFLGPRRDRDTQPGEKSSQRGAEDPPRVVWPSDPVLRVALMRAGILTAEDLRAAEEQLRSAFGDTLKGDQGWSVTEGGSTASSTRTDNAST